MTNMLVEVVWIERKFRGAALGPENQWQENDDFITSFFSGATLR